MVNKMRDIKFRVWLKEIKTMQYSDKLSSFFKDYEGTNIQMMQYTGMEDKNGVEIYDGDKVYFVKTYNNKRYVGEVRYVKEVAGYMLCAMYNESWHSFEFGLGTAEVEIIGNIHEQEPHT